jgi:glucose-1-phosphate adenylyltransferase
MTDPPVAMPGHPDRSLASMGVYIFSAKYRGTRRDIADQTRPMISARTSFPAPCETAVPQRTRFLSGAQSVVRQKTTGATSAVDAYWDANIDLTATDPKLNHNP